LQTIQGSYGERLKTMFSDFPRVEIIGEAGNGTEAIRATQKLKPDVVIPDIRMPERNGIEVLKDIKENNSSPLVIVLTNYPYPQYQKRCMELEAKYFFKKSSEFEKVAEVFKQLDHDFKT